MELYKQNHVLKHLKGRHVFSAVIITMNKNICNNYSTVCMKHYYYVIVIILLSEKRKVCIFLTLYHKN